MGEALFELKLGTSTTLNKVFRNLGFVITALNSLCLKYMGRGNTSCSGY